MTKSDMDQNGYRLKQFFFFFLNPTRMTEWVSIYFLFNINNKIWIRYMSLSL